MTDGRSIAGVWQRAMEVNLRYYEGLARLATEYVQELVGALRDARPPAAVAGGPPPIHSPASPEPVRARQSVLVLEGDAGAPAQGAFIVENRLGRRVSAPLAVGAFTDGGGREVHPQLRFDPEVVTLDPGEQVLVRVEANVDEEVEPGATYRGEVTVPGLPGGGVMLGVRRREATALPAARRPRTGVAPARGGPARKRSTPRRKTTRRRRS